MGILAGPLSESACQWSKYARTPFGDQRALLLESGTPAAPPAAAAAVVPHPLPVAAEAELHGGTAEEESGGGGDGTADITRDGGTKEKLIARRVEYSIERVAERFAGAGGAPTGWTFVAVRLDANELRSLGAI